MRPHRPKHHTEEDRRAISSLPLIAGAIAVLLAFLALLGVVASRLGSRAAFTLLAVSMLSLGDSCVVAVWRVEHGLA